MNLLPLHKDEIVGQFLRIIGIFILVPSIALFVTKNIGFGWFCLVTIVGWIIYDIGITVVVERQLKERLKKSLPRDAAAKID